MCFSATASFAASGGLAVLGVASLAHARKKDKILAAVPLMFAVQQALEGVQWTYLNQGLTSPGAAYGFLLFALIVWPAYVPLTVFALDRKKRTVLGWVLILGILTSAFFAHMLLTSPVGIMKVGSCIDYKYSFPFRVPVTAAYLLAVFAPLLLSSLEVFRRFGAAIVVLAAVSWLFFAVAFTSVWCFFAAVVSSMFYLYIRQQGKSGKR